MNNNLSQNNKKASYKKSNLKIDYIICLAMGISLGVIYGIKYNKLALALGLGVTFGSNIGLILKGINKEKWCIKKVLYKNIIIVFIYIKKYNILLLI